MQPILVRLSLGLVGPVFVLAACSGSSDNGSAGGSGSSGTSGDPNPSCVCNITSNGETKKVACGGSDCVGNMPYQCGTGAKVTQGGTGCSAPPMDAGTDAPPPATTIPCGMKGLSAQSCDATKEYCLISKFGTTGTGGDTCAPFPSGCHACGCATSNAEAAWKAANNGTNNCTSAVISCNASNGAISVTCQK